MVRSPNVRNRFWSFAPFSQRTLPNCHWLVISLYVTLKANQPFFSIYADQHKHVLSLCKRCSWHCIVHWVSFWHYCSTYRSLGCRADNSKGKKRTPWSKVQNALLELYTKVIKSRGLEVWVWLWMHRRRPRLWSWSWCLAGVSRAWIGLVGETSWQGRGRGGAARRAWAGSGTGPGWDWGWTQGCFGVGRRCPSQRQRLPLLPGEPGGSVCLLTEAPSPLWSKTERTIDV